MHRPYRGKHRRPRRARAAPVAAVGVAAVVGGYGGWQAATWVTDAAASPAGQTADSAPRGALGDDADDRTPGHRSDVTSAADQGSRDTGGHDSWRAVAWPGAESAVGQPPISGAESAVAPAATSGDETAAARTPPPSDDTRASADEEAQREVVDDPARIAVPSIEVSAPLAPLGLDQEGRLETPSEFDTAGWWRGGPEPGEPGPAVIAGHVDSYRGPAVFYALDQLSPGDEIQVHDEDGTTAHFVVDRVEQHPKDAFPTEDVYGDTRQPTLRLITCTGPFDDAQNQYRHNLIVYAEGSPKPE